MKKIILFILILFIIPLVIIAKEKHVDKINQYFVPHSPIYFIKEWSRSFDLAITSSPELRIKKITETSFQKLVEIEEYSHPDQAAIDNYLKEINKLEIALSSIEINDSLLNYLIGNSFFQKKVIDGFDNINEKDKEVILLQVFSVLIPSNYANQEKVIEYIKKYTQGLSIINSIQSIDLAMMHLNEYSKELLLIHQLNLISSVSNMSLTDQENEFIRNKLDDIKRTNYYQQMITKKTQLKEQELKEGLLKARWIDEIMNSVKPEEKEELEKLKTYIVSAEIEQIEELIENAQIYPETKTLLQDAKNYIQSLYQIEEINIIENTETKIISSVTSKAYVTEPSNPASAYCLRKGYKLQEIKKAGIVERRCIIDEDTSCEEWTYYKKECGKDK